MQLDDRFEDVDFTKDPNYVFGAQEETIEGLSGICYEETIELLSQNQLREAAENQEENGGGEDFVTRIFDQRQEGSCVGNACTQGVEFNQAKVFGRDKVVPLSAISLYKQIGRSAQSGAVVSDGMRALQNTGVLPLDTPENRERFGENVMPNTGFNSRYPAGWKEVAKKFRATEVNVIRSVEGILTALARQDCVVVGREGHSILYVRLLWDNGKWKVPYVNSWGNWGYGLGSHDYGFGTDTASQIKKSANWAFAIRDIVVGN